MTEEEKGFSLEALRKEFLTDEEQEKVRQIARAFNSAYWRVWFGKIFGNHVALTENLRKMKQLITELGI